MPTRDDAPGRRGRSRSRRPKRTSIAHGPIASSPSATAPAKAAIASTVRRIAWAKAAWPSVASRPARWGSSEVWIAWKSCSGARAISSALKTSRPAAVGRRRATSQHRGVEQRLLGELDRRDRRGEARALRASRRGRAARGRRRCGVGRRGGASAHGTPAATPTAPRGCPARPPSARGDADRDRDREAKRDIDSKSTSPP